LARHGQPVFPFPFFSLPLTRLLGDEAPKRGPLLFPAVERNARTPPFPFLWLGLDESDPILLPPHTIRQHISILPPPFIFFFFFFPSWEAESIEALNFPSFFPSSTAQRKLTSCLFSSFFFASSRVIAVSLGCLFFLFFKPATAHGRPVVHFPFSLFSSVGGQLSDRPFRLFSGWLVHSTVGTFAFFFSFSRDQQARSRSGLGCISFPFPLSPQTGCTSSGRARRVRQCLLPPPWPERVSFFTRRTRRLPSESEVRFLPFPQVAQAGKKLGGFLPFPLRTWYRFSFPFLFSPREESYKIHKPAPPPPFPAAGVQAGVPCAFPSFSLSRSF